MRLGILDFGTLVISDGFPGKYAQLLKYASAVVTDVLIQLVFGIQIVQSRTDDMM